MVWPVVYPQPVADLVPDRFHADDEIVVVEGTPAVGQSISQPDLIPVWFSML